MYEVSVFSDVRQPGTSASAFEGHLLLAAPYSKVMTSVIGLPARKENGISTVTFLWSAYYLSPTTRKDLF